MQHDIPPQRPVVVAFDASRRAFTRPGPVVRPGSFPLAAGLLLGLGLGGLFDGVVLHRLAQWYRLLTSPGGLTSIETVGDGVLDVAAYAFVAIGVALLWRAARSVHARWSHRLLAGTILMGFGAFSVVDTIANRSLLRLPSGNGSASGEQWIAWALLGSSLAMAIGGWGLYRSGRAAAERPAEPAAATTAAASWHKR